MAEERVDLVVPRWFLQLAGGAMTLFMLTFLPWAIWQTRGMMMVEIKMGQVDSLSTELQNVKLEQIRRSRDSNSIVENREDIRELERKINELEKKIHD